MQSILIILVVLITTGLSHAQIDPLYAQYLNNPLLINPAYTGYSNSLNAAASYRKQWGGFDGSPTTMTATAHSSVRDNQMGVGLFVSQDKIGANKNTEIQATYAYKLDFGKTKLSFGLQTGVINFRTDYSELNPQDPSAPEFSSNINELKYSFGSGIMLTGEQFLVGLSVPRMLKNSVDLGSGEVEVYQQHYYFQAAYVHQVSPRTKLKPSVLLKGVKGAPVSGDYTFAVNLDDRYNFGLYTRNLKAYGLLAQLKLTDRYRFGYAFEIPTNRSVGTRFTTHEITIGISTAAFRFHDLLSVNNF